MVKSKVIRRLLENTNMDDAEIAGYVDTSRGYVAIVRRDLENGGGSNCRYRLDAYDYRLRNKSIRNRQRKTYYDKTQEVSK